MSFSKTNCHLEDNLQVIIRGCIAGDRISQGRLYHLFSSDMFGTCVWYARNREEAEEILQDGFLRVFKYLHTYKGHGSFIGWLRRTMISAALTKYRNKSSNLWVVANYDDENQEISQQASFVSNYDEKLLIQLIQNLPPAYRMVFNLYVFEGYTHKEIAQALRISEGTSKSNLFDARKILQKALNVKSSVASSKIV